MNSNDKTSIALALMACVFGLAGIFMPEKAATAYMQIPTFLAGASASLLLQNKDSSDLKK